MLIYRLLSRVFPRNFTAKIVAVCFVGIHVPLITFAAWVILVPGGRSDMASLAILLAATLAGTAATVAALYGLLTPLRLAAQRLTRWRPGDGDVRPLPDTYRDEVGRLMVVANRMMRTADRKISDTNRAAETDPLTGLLNRRGLYRAWPDLGGAGVLLVFDVDRFKLVNDGLGHQAGDAVLKRIGQLAVRSLRDGDVIVRLGGDEFLVWLPGVGLEDARALAERLRRAVADRMGGGEMEGGLPGPTISIGGAEALEQVDLSWLMEEADRALYRAKEAGRNIVVLAGDSRLDGEFAEAV